MVVIFIKELKQTDIEYRLSWPTESLGQLPDFRGGHQVDFEATDERGNHWAFRCSVRRMGQYPKPVITSGWLDFVRANRLCTGDTIVFYKHHLALGRQPFYGVRVYPRGTPLTITYLFGHILV